MNKLFIILFSTILIMVGCSKQQSGYHIEGCAPDGATYVFLKELIGNNLLLVDSVSVDEEGDFKLEGRVDIPVMAYLSVRDQGNFAKLCLSNDEFVVSREEGTSKFDVHGGVENEWYKSFMREYNSLLEDKAALFSYIDSIVEENPDKISLAYVLFKQAYNDLNVDEVELLVSKFNSDVKLCSYITELSKIIKQNRLTQSGEKYIDFLSKNTEGELISFSSSFDNKSFVLLDFWASWCPYCRIENPSLVELHSMYHDEEIKIISVSLDSNRDDWLNAIEQDKLQWLNLSNLDRWECEAAKLYGINAIPGNVLFSPDGIIIAKNIYGEELKKLVTTKLSENYEK